MNRDTDTPPPVDPGADDAQADGDAAVASWYLLDAQDRIEAVSPDWDRFALRNNGAGALAAQVLGRPLQDFLSGDATRMFLAAAIEAARITGRPRALPYRCDAPDRQRQLEMVLRPLEQQRVRVEHRLLHSRERPRSLFQKVLGPERHTADQHPRAVLRPWRRCSQCQTLCDPLLAAPHWRPAHALQARLAPPPLLVRDEVCPDCRVRLAELPLP